MRRSMRGPLPPPEILAEYPVETQERILRMAEAGSTDESKRRDQLVGSSTKVAERSQPITLVMYFGALLFAAGTYWAFQNIALSLAFLSVPVFKVIGATVTASIRKRERDEDE